MDDATHKTGTDVSNEERHLEALIIIQTSIQVFWAAG
jgi:hypothetical protein